MNEKLNIAEILKDCPKGMELYSPLCGKCVFNRINFGTIICTKQNNQNITFTSEGYYMLPVFDNCECMIFPSKENRDWSTFQRPFKDGDILITEKGSVFIYKGPMYYNKLFADFYCGYTIFDGAFVPKLFNENHFGDISKCRLATEEEKQKLFDAIKTNGYKWDDKTKTLEKLIEPKFKVGDRVKKNKDYISGIVTDIFDDSFKVTYDGGGCSYVQFRYQDEWKLVPNKFDITTLKPFESKILVRNVGAWEPAFFGYYSKEYAHPFVVVGGNTFAQCVPYEENKHLLGTTKDCDDFYKTWE